jgi:hypothetical protein
MAEHHRAPQSSGDNHSGTGLLNLPGTTSTTALHPTPVASMITVQVPAEDDEDEMLPAMADDDYSAQLSFQSQSKDNLKCVSDRSGREPTPGLIRRL